MVKAYKGKLKKAKTDHVFKTDSNFFEEQHPANNVKNVSLTIKFHKRCYS